MAKYRVLEKSFINGRIVEAGEVVDIDIAYDADRDTNLQPVKANVPLTNPAIDAAVAAAATPPAAPPEDPLV